MNMFFSADYHLFHDKIRLYADRPYISLDQMHKAMVLKHNQIVTDKDEVWNIGDVAMLSSEFVGKLRKEINKFKGIKHLVVGNHDRWRIQLYEDAGFSTTHTAFWFKYNELTFYLAHDPEKYTSIEDDPKSIMLCGHIHKLFKHLLPEKRIINVGVDVWNFAPVSFDQILLLLKDYGIW